MIKGIIYYTEEERKYKRKKCIQPDPPSPTKIQSCDISEAVFVIIGKHEIEDSPGRNIYFLRIIKPIL